MWVRRRLPVKFLSTSAKNTGEAAGVDGASVRVRGGLLGFGVALVIAAPLVYGTSVILPETPPKPIMRRIVNPSSKSATFVTANGASELKFNKFGMVSLSDVYVEEEGKDDGDVVSGKGSIKKWNDDNLEILLLPSFHRVRVPISSFPTPESDTIVSTPDHTYVRVE